MNARCHCGRPACVGVGFNARPLNLCQSHHRAFQIARRKEMDRNGGVSKLAELDVSRRVWKALRHPVA